MWGDRKKKREFEKRKAIAKDHFIAAIARTTAQFEVIAESTQHAEISFRQITRTMNIVGFPEYMVRVLHGVPEIAEVGDDWYDATYFRNLSEALSPIYDQLYYRDVVNSAQRFWASIA